MKAFSLLVIALLASSLLSHAALEVRVSKDADSLRPFEHYWKRCVGSGHALLATRADYQAQLATFKHDLDIERVRMHGIFDDDMSVVLAPGRYEFYNVDQAYDYMLSIGVRPIVELSFMPGLLAGCSPWDSNGEPCQYVMHYHGIVMPPVNFSDWRNLVAALGQHLVDRYGLAEVSQWNFEVWNELWGMNYPHPYLELYNAARDGLKSVDPSLRIGGPVTMQCQYIGEFVSDTNGKFDFISTHLYPTDPNCTWPAPGSGDIDCFANTIKAAKAKVPAGVDFYLTEYNAGLFNASLLYSAYAAAFVFRNVPLLHGVLDIWSYWTFSDIFEENGMHSAPFEGFNYGMQTVRGVKKPVYRAFQLLKDAGKTFDILNFTNSGPNTTLAGFYTPVGNSNISVFLSNFAPLGFAIETEIVSIPFSPATTCANSAVHAHIIDDTTTNPHHAWEQLGRPAYPTHTQLAILNQASFPATKVVPIVQQANGDCMIQITSRAYSAIRLDIQF